MCVCGGGRSGDCGGSSGVLTLMAVAIVSMEVMGGGRGQDGGSQESHARLHHNKTFFFFTILRPPHPHPTPRDRGTMVTARKRRSITWSIIYLFPR